MTICQKCRHKNTVGEFFCEQCGSALITTIPVPAYSSDFDGIICVNCYTLNRPGSLFCNRCGSPLPLDDDTPYTNGAELHAQVRRATQARNAESTTGFRHGQPMLYIQGASKPFALSAQRENILGRKSSQTGVQPTIDLNLFDGYNLGVSRLHAAITYDKGSFFLRDLDSTNGTFLNGKPVPPNHTLALNSGDEIRLGNLACYVHL